MALVKNQTKFKMIQWNGIRLSLLLLLGLQSCFIHCQNTKQDSTLTINKCDCKANEIQTINGCQEENNLPVQIWDKMTSTVEHLNISTLPYNIKQVECSETQIKHMEMNWAFISREGKLIEYGHPDTDLYCIENVRNDMNETSQRIEKCVQKFRIRLCCQIDEYMDSGSRCTKIPNVSTEESVSTWIDNFIHETSYVQCTGSDLMHLALPSDVHDLKNSFSMYQNVTEQNVCLGMYGDENEMYPAATFCRSYEASMTSMMQPEIPYCCPPDYAFDIEIQSCVPSTEHYVYPHNEIPWPSQGAKITVSKMNCSHMSVLEFKDSVNHSLSPNGSILDDSGKEIPLDNYCLGSVVVMNSTIHSGLTCFLEVDESSCSWRLEVYKACLIISSIFLVATLIVYLGIADLRRRIGGVCLIAELIALLISQILLMIIQTYQAEFSATGCLVVGIFEIIFVLASFFWLNIMCYDVWSTFRVLRSFREKVFNTKLFLKYSLYAWGIPIAIGIIAVIVEKLDAELKPNFSPQSGCFFSDQNDPALQWLYIYGIILLLLVINMAFFIHLSKTLSGQFEQRKKVRQMGESSTQQPKPDMENVKLYFKLFVVMGLPWLIEVFTSFASKETLCYIWILDFFNMIRGVLIFVIFVCKKSTRDLIIATWFPSYKPKEGETHASRKTSTMSLSSWIPSIGGRKISKVSVSSGGNVNPETLRAEHDVIKEEEDL